MKCFGSGGPTSNGRPMDALDQVHTLTFDAFGTILDSNVTTLIVGIMLLAFAVNLWFLIGVPLVGYAFAWYAHFFVEHNKPATFEHPFYSLLADYRMLFLMMAGRMDAEVERCCGGGVEVITHSA